MSEQNYTPPEPVQSHEVVVDDAKRPWKAYVGALVGGVGAAVAWWVADEDPFTAKDAGEAFLAFLAVAVPGFGLTFATPNPKVTKPASEV